MGEQIDWSEQYRKAKKNLLVASKEIEEWVESMSAKRAFDVCTAVCLILLLMPVIVVTAVLVRLKLGTPVIFKQTRPGLHGKPFQVWKFRTMTDQRDNQGQLLPDHVRLTAFGRLLRKLSLDELPQLWNVLRGDLSLVGPRPLLMDYLPLYTETQARRHLVRPGITGWAQVNGRNQISWEEKFELDIWYVDHHSFWLDVRILMLTVLKVFRSEGISNGTHVTMPVFRGTVHHQQESGGSL